MERIINKIKIFNNDNEISNNISFLLKEELSLKGFKIVDEDYDLAIAVGGDGSFLRMVRKNDFNDSIYYIGVNAGTLGFAQEINIADRKVFIENLNSNNFKIEEIGIQETIIKHNSLKQTFYSLNEIVVRDKDLNTIDLNIKIDDNFLERFKGDGILVSTTFGSTAYNLSFNGSIVYSNLHTLQLTPIAPLNNRSYRNLLNSVIVPENTKITIIPNNNKSIILTVDGENSVFNDVESLDTMVNKKRIKCIRNLDYNFSKKINEKFLS